MNPTDPVSKSWAVGVMVVPQRRAEHFPRTLSSLKASGFLPDRLFVDGGRDHASWEGQFGIPVTMRYPNLGVCGNWILGMEELMMRFPHATHYLMSQDDVAFPRNLKAYLDRVPYPDRGYWNLYTTDFTSQAPPPKRDYTGFYLSNQLGRGALALAFSREALGTLLEHRDIVRRSDRVTDNDKLYGWRKIDGGVVTAMRKAGYQEWVHSPSLCQHTGTVSTIDKRKHVRSDQPCGTDESFPPYHWFIKAPDWRGEEFDCLSLLGSNA